MARTCTKRIGNTRVTILNDGQNVFGYDLFPNNTEDEINTLLAQRDKTEIETRFNCCLIEPDHGRNILVDAGVGTLFGDVAGHIGDAFAEIGFDPASISTVVFTHLHPDHIGGALDEDGKPTFPNAEIIIDENEYNFWTNPSFDYPDLAEWKDIADKFIAAYSTNLKTLKRNGEIASDIRFEALYGHTPGHSGVRVESAGTQFIYVSDLFVVQDVQLQDPTIQLGFDLDPETGVEVRTRTLNKIATDTIYFSGGHILGPTIGLLEKAGKGYEVVSHS